MENEELILRALRRILKVVDQVDMGWNYQSGCPKLLDELLEAIEKIKE